MNVGNRHMGASGDRKQNTVRLLGAVMMGTLLIGVLAACDAGGGNPTPTPLPGNATPTVQPGPTRVATAIPTAVSVETPPAQRPADFSLTYDWRAGSMPPPFHYEYTVSISPDGEGKV